MEIALNDKKMAIYQAKDGAIEFRSDLSNHTIWGSINQISELFGVQKAGISKHLKKIYTEKELDKKATVSILETVQKEGKRKVVRQITYYNLDAIISVGYRINSKKATEFRIWATKTLKQHITKGFTINKNILKKKENLYLQVLEDIKQLSEENNIISNRQIIDLIKDFSSTWFSLESYDKQNFPKKGVKKTIKEIDLESFSKKLYKEVTVLKQELIQKKEATELFAQEKNTENLKGILGNVLQSVFGEDAYKTVEEKASHLLYFVVKNHPFTDGNKRTGAFSFIWFLREMQFDFQKQITPETLTVLTLLIAESNPKDKEKIVGLILLLLENN